MLCHPLLRLLLFVGASCGFRINLGNKQQYKAFIPAKNSFVAISLAFGLVVSGPIVGVEPAYSRNIPEFTGASGKYSGDVSALLPIIKIRNIVIEALKKASDPDGSLEECNSFLKRLPQTESEFKKIFDEYSEGISYKQRFLDQNAFLVYYTKGFDGVGRPSIETEDPNMVKGAKQYGARNEAWVAMDNARSEMIYLLSLDRSNPERRELGDLIVYLKSELKAFSDYIDLASPTDVAKAEALLQ